jgi:excisionase family DNA binding protein
MTAATAPDLAAATTAALDLVLTDALERATARLIEHAGPRAYGPAEVATRLGISRRSVYRLIQDGRLPIVPHLPEYRVSASALEAFMRGEG